MERSKLVVVPLLLGIHLRIDLFVNFPAQFPERITYTVVVEREKACQEGSASPNLSPRDYHRGLLNHKGQIAISRQCR